MESKKNKKKREKPISLHPLEFEDALTEILKIPIDRGKKTTPDKNNNKKNNRLTKGD